MTSIQTLNQIALKTNKEIEWQSGKPEIAMAAEEDQEETHGNSESIATGRFRNDNAKTVGSNEHANLSTKEGDKGGRDQERSNAQNTKQSDALHQFKAANQRVDMSTYMSLTAQGEASHGDSTWSHEGNNWTLDLANPSNKTAEPPTTPIDIPKTFNTTSPLPAPVHSSLSHGAKLGVPNKRISTSPASTLNWVNNSSTPPTFVPQNLTRDAMPYSKRWRHYFNESRGGFLYFRHLRKAAGTTVHNYLNQVAVYHETIRRQRRQQELNGTRQSIYKDENKGLVVYAMLEFNSMDGQCPFVDPKWKDSLTVIAVRHPIERTLSEFFYSGAYGQRELMDLYRQARRAGNTAHSQAFNRTRFIELLHLEFPKWIKKGLIATKRGSLDRHFSDDYQTRALTAITSNVPKPYKVGYGPKFQVCKYYNYYPEDNQKKQPKKQQKPDKNDNTTKLTLQVNSLCIDGPCRYGKSYYKSFYGNHNLTLDTLEQGKRVLDAFDIVLVAETISEEESRFLATVMDVPLANASLTKSTANVQIVRQTATQHTYQSMFEDVAPDLLEVVRKYSRLDMELYQHAVKINRRMLQAWRAEQDQAGNAAGETLS